MPSEPDPLHRLHGLASASHYHNAADRQPQGNPIQAGQERIELVTGGRGWLWHEETWQTVEPGDLLWQCAEDNCIGRSDPQRPYSCLALSFVVPTDGWRPVSRMTRWEDLDAVRDLTRRACRSFADERIDRHLLGQYLYSTLLFFARRWQLQIEQHDLPPQLAQAVDLLEQRFAEDLSIAEIADTVRWSATHLHEQFRQHLDSSPHQYLIRRRIRAAKELLTSTDLAIARIADRCGFASAAHFARSFKQTVGETASAFRKRNWLAG